MFASFARAGGASATVLTFDMVASDFDPVNVLYPTYGDNVKGASGAPFHPEYSYGLNKGITPDVTVTFGSGVRFAASVPLDPHRAYGDLHNILFRSNDFQNDNLISVTFTSSVPGAYVHLFSFDVATGYDATIPGTAQDLPVRFTVYDGNTNTALYSEPGTVITGGPTHTTFVLNQPNGVSAQTLRLVIDVGMISNKTESYAVDNITFGEDGYYIPTPGTTSLFAFGATAVSARRRRRR